MRKDDNYVGEVISNDNDSLVRANKQKHSHNHKEYL